MALNVNRGGQSALSLRPTPWKGDSDPGFPQVVGGGQMNPGMWNKII